MSNPFEVLKVEGEGSGTPAAFDEKVAEEEQVDVSPGSSARSDRRQTHSLKLTPVDVRPALDDSCSSDQWLRVVKPAKSDVHVRVTEPFGDMEHLPSNCSLMAVSNSWNLVFIGTSKRTSGVTRRAFERIDHTDSSSRTFFPGIRGRYSGIALVRSRSYFKAQPEPGGCQ